MAKLTDLLLELGKQSGGTLDRDLKALADQQEELLQAKKELKGFIDMADKAGKPSAYPPELVKYMKKVGIKYGEKDGDQKKNLKLLQEAMEKLSDLEQAQQFQIQRMVSDLGQLFQTMSSQLNQINKDQMAAIKNLRS